MQLFLSMQCVHHCLHKSISRQGFSMQPQVSEVIQNQLGEKLYLIFLYHESQKCGGVVVHWRRSVQYCRLSGHLNCVFEA